VPGAEVVAQAPPSTRAGFSLGVFADFPEPFLPEYCEQSAVAATGSGGMRVAPGIRAEVQAVVSGGWGGMTCAIPGIPAPPPGSEFDRRTFADEIEGMSFLTTIVSVVGELTPRARSSFRARVGVGRLWRKGLGMWSLGVGYRRDVGMGRMLVEVDRWSLNIPFTEEHILVGSEGAWLVQSSAEKDQAERPFLFRLGYEVRIR
jgi:hypothetical protein